MSKGTKPARFYNSKENELEDQKIVTFGELADFVESKVN